MSAGLTPPDGNPPTAQWFSKLQLLVNASVKSGTTANRPAQHLFPGRFYFDASLGANGKPIWCNKTATGWVLADGTAA